MRRALSATPRLPVLLVLLLTLAGGALRADAAASPSRYQSADERAYAGLARGIAERGHYAHRNMADPVHWPPGAPFLFAAAVAVDDAPRADGVLDVPSAYPLQALVATALIPATAALALLAAGPAAAVLAGGAVAFYPPLITGAGDLLSEPLGALLLAAALLALLVALRRPAPWRFAVTGVLLGALLLTRTDLLLVPLLAAAIVAVVRVRAGAPRRAGACAAAIVLAGCAVTIAPWVVFASSVAGRPVPITTGGGSNLFVGTYLPGDGTMFGLKREYAGELRALDPRLKGVPAANLPQERVLHAVTTQRPGDDRDAALQAAGLENLRRYALGRPVDFAAMAAGKAGRLWLRPSIGTFRSPRAGLTALHLALVGLSVVGIAVALARRRGHPLLWLAAAIALYVTALNAVLVAEARHALPVLPVLFAAGAAGWMRTVTPIQEPVR